MQLVWPTWQRLLHGLLALSVLTALATFEGGSVHEAAGYVALVMAVLRIALGLAGPHVARFKTFMRSPAATLAYARLLQRGQEPRHLNHNPLGAWMVLLLLLTVSVSAALGALFVTDAFWGINWVIVSHAALAWALLPLILLHWAGVWHASRRHGENLAAAMWHGKKRAPDLESRDADASPPAT
jgi:cytochrome b